MPKIKIKGTTGVPVPEADTLDTVCDRGSVTNQSITTGGASLDGAVVINESGADADCRIEGDTNANLFFTDAGNDRVGIRTNLPGYPFQINGETFVNSNLRILRYARLYMAHDRDTYFRTTADGNQMNIMVNGSNAFRISWEHVSCYTHKGYIFAGWLGVGGMWLAVRERAGNPGIMANYGMFYTKDIGGTTECFAMDDAGNATQLTSHDKEGYYLHKSKIPKRGIELEIDIEKFFRDKYPEYIREKKIEKEE